MQFQVPQFIETESKIVGPLTLRQFIFVAVGAGLSFLALYLFNFFIAFILIAIVASATVALAFIKVNGRSFPSILKSAFGYYWNPHFYVWKKETSPLLQEPSLKTPERRAARPDSAAVREKLSFGSKLQNVWERITTSRSGISKREKTERPAARPKERYETLEMSSGEKEKMKRIDYR